MLEGSIQEMGGKGSALGLGDPQRSPSQIQLAICDADYGSKHPDAPWDQAPWTRQDFFDTAKVLSFSHWDHDAFGLSLNV